MHVFFAPHPPLAVPAIGGVNERPIQDTLDGFEKMGEAIAEIKPDTIIFISPHGNAFREALSFLDKELIHGDFAMFGHHEVVFDKKVNLALTKSLAVAIKTAGVPTVLLNDKTSREYGVRPSLDHGAMVPMHYIDRHYVDYDIVQMTSSFASSRAHMKAGNVISETCEALGRKVVLVASGDLSHALKEEGPYSYNPFGPIFDEMVRDAIINKDPQPLLALSEKEIEDAAQCGLRSFCLAFGYAGGSYGSEVFSYEGPFGVGYLTGTLFE